MSQRRWGWFLLGLCAFCLILGRTPAPSLKLGTWGISAALGWIALLWIFSLISPPAMRWHPAIGAWLAWIAWTGIACLISKDPGQGLEPFAWSATCVLLFLLAHAWWGGAHRRAWAIELWVVVPLALFLWSKPEIVCLLSAAAAACWGIWMGSTVGLPSWRRELALAGVCALAFVLLYGSWGACFGFFFSAAFCTIHSGREGRWAVASVCGVALIVWVLLLYQGAIRDGFGWLQIAWNNPAAGIGLGLLPSGTEQLPPFFLRLAAETGCIGLGIYACATFKSLPANFKSLSWESRAAAAVLYAFIGQSLVDGVPGNRGLQILFFSALAGASNWARAQEGPELSQRVEERHGRVKPLWASAVGFALCLAAIVFQRSRAIAAAEANSPQPEARIAGLEWMARLEPSNPAVKVRLAKNLLFFRPSRLGSSLARLDEAIRLDSRNAFYLGLKADLFGLVGDWERAGEWAQRAVAIEPEFPGARLTLAESLIHHGDRESASRQLALAKQIHDTGYRASPEILFWDQARYDRILKELKRAPR